MLNAAFGGKSSKSSKGKGKQPSGRYAPLPENSKRKTPIPLGNRFNKRQMEKFFRLSGKSDEWIEREMIRLDLIGLAA